jgi:hypothetical protein
MATEYIHTFNFSYSMPRYWQKYFDTNFPNCYYENYGDHIDLKFQYEISDADVVKAQQTLNSYTEPPYYLTLARTQEFFLNTTKTSNSSPEILQTFIMSPESNSNQVMANMKAIVELNLTTTTSLNELNNNESVILQIYCTTRSNMIKNITIDISDAVSTWKTNQSIDKRIWKSVQIYGLKEMNPTYDCIWQLKLATSNPCITAGISSLQKLIYNVETPNNSVGAI